MSSRRAKRVMTGELPDGARKLRPKQLGPGYHWVPTLKVDARLDRHGVTWLRVRGGFGGDGHREDWIMAVKGLGESVNDYNWNGEEFGEDLGDTREEAFDAKVDDVLKRQLPYKIEEAAGRLSELVEAELLLKSAIEKRTK